MNTSLIRIPMSGDKLADLCISGFKCAACLFGFYTLLKLSKNGVNDIKVVHNKTEITISSRNNVFKVDNKWIAKDNFMKKPQTLKCLLYHKVAIYTRIRKFKLGRNGLALSIKKLRYSRVGLCDYLN